MRKRSNPTNRTSYLQFCDLLAVFGARLTEYRYPDRLGIGFGTHCRIGRVATECDRSPGEPKATPAPGIGENVGGELGRSPTLLAEGHAKEPQATRRARRRSRRAGSRRRPECERSERQGAIATRNERSEWRARRRSRRAAPVRARRSFKYYFLNSFI